MLIKNKYYKKGSFEEAQESLRSIIRLLEKDGNAKASIVVHDKGYTIMTFIPPNETIRLK